MSTPDSFGMSPGSTAPHNGAYGDQSQVGGSTSEMQVGIQGETNPLNTASVYNLARNAARFNAMVPHQIRPTFQTPIQSNPGGNGLSASQNERRWADGSPQGNPNGMAADSFAKAALLKMAGQDSGVE